MQDGSKGNTVSVSDIPAIGTNQFKALKSSPVKQKVDIKPIPVDSIPVIGSAEFNALKKKEPTAPSPSASPSPGGQPPSTENPWTKTIPNPFLELAPEVAEKPSYSLEEIQAKTQAVTQDMTYKMGLAPYGIQKTDTFEEATQKVGPQTPPEYVGKTDVEIARMEFEKNKYPLMDKTVIQPSTEEQRQKTVAHTPLKKSMLDISGAAEDQLRRDYDAENGTKGVFRSETVNDLAYGWLKSAAIIGNTAQGLINFSEDMIVDPFLNDMEKSGIPLKSMIEDMRKNALKAKGEREVTLAPEPIIAFHDIPGTFADKADKLAAQYEAYSGDSRFDKTLKDVSSMLGFFATIPATKAFVGGASSALSKLTNAATLSERAIEVHGMALAMGSEAFADYANMTKQGAPVEEKAKALAEGFGTRAATGYVFGALGYNAGMFGKIIADKYAPHAVNKIGMGFSYAPAKTAQVLSTVGANALGFAGFENLTAELGGATREEVLERQKSGAVMGAALGAREVAGLLSRRAAYNFMNAPGEMLNKFAQTPAEITKMREAAIERREWAKENPKDKNVENILDEADRLDGWADVSAMRLQAIKHGKEMKQMIQEDPTIPAEDKVKLIKQIDESIASQDRHHEEASAISKNIKAIEELIDDNNKNVALSEEEKAIRNEPLAALVAEGRQTIKDLYKERADITTVTQSEEAKSATVTNRKEYEKALVEVVGYGDGIAKRYGDLSELAAKQWAKETGRPQEEWYKETFESVQNEAEFLRKRVEYLKEKEGLSEAAATEKARKEADEDMGAVSFTAQGKAIVTAFKGADSSTVAHEALAHPYFERRIREAEGGSKVAKDILESMFSEPDVLAKKYTYEKLQEERKAKVEAMLKGEKFETPIYEFVHEKFAAGFETYLKEGQKAKTKGLQKVFDDFKDWMLSIYRVATHGIEISDGMRELYKQMLGVEPTQKAVDALLKEVKPIENEKETLQAETGKEVVPEPSQTQAPTPELKVEVEPVVEQPKKEVPNATEKRIKPKSDKSKYPGAPQGQPEVRKTKGSKRDAEVEQTNRGDSNVAGGKEKKIVEKDVKFNVSEHKRGVGEMRGGKFVKTGTEIAYGIEFSVDNTRYGIYRQGEKGDWVTSNGGYADIPTKNFGKGTVSEMKKKLIDYANGEYAPSESPAKAERKVIASVKGTDIKLDVPREVAGSMAHKTFWSKEAAEHYVTRVKEAYIRTHPELDASSPELYQKKLDMTERAKEISVEEKDRIHTSPVGSDKTSPHETYAKATQSKISDKGKNIWVRNSKDPNNADRVLMVQISNPVINPVREGRIDKFLDKLYRTRPGYKRPEDFFEIPLWTTTGAQNLGNKGDFYAVRDMQEAKEFLKNAKYKGVAMSALDVNAGFIKELVEANPETQFLIGGYVKEGTFKEHKNVMWADTFDQISKLSGKDYVPGFSYKLFDQTGTMPRLKMSEGCRNKCAFCSIPKEVIPVSKEIIDQQVKDMEKLDADLVYVDDKTYFEAKNAEYLAEVYKTMKAKNPKFIGFVVQTTASQLLRIPPEFLKRSGIKYVELGVETFNDNFLKALHKPTTEKITQEATNKLRENGIALIPNIIVGIRVKDAKGNWLEESLSTYKKTLDYLKANKDIISHPNIYNLSVYEGTETARDLNSLSAIDRNELVIGKTFHERPKVHEKAFDMFVKFGEEVLDSKPAMGSENEMLYQPKKGADEASREAVRLGVAQRKGDITRLLYGSDTPEASGIKPMQGFIHRGINKLFFNQPVVGALTRLQLEQWGRMVDKGGDATAKLFAKGLETQNDFIRGGTKSLDGLIANLGKSLEQIEAGEHFGGAQDTAKLDSILLAKHLYDIVNRDPESLRRIDRVLDPEFYAKKTLAQYTAYLKGSMSKEKFAELDPSEIKELHDALSESAGWNDPAYKDTVLSDLTASEFSAYELIRSTFDLIHDVNYGIGKISTQDYQKYLGNYSARFYAKNETPADIREEIQAFTNKMESGMYKRRGIVDDWKMQNKLPDPIYAVSKRMAQTMSNLAIYDYAKWIVNENPTLIKTKSDPNVKGYTWMGQGYGPLTNHYLRSDVSESFKGFMYTSAFMKGWMDTGNAYSKWGLRRALKSGVTVYRPDTRLGNVFGNVVFANFVGINPIRYFSNRSYAKMQQKQYGEDFRFLLKKGLIDPGQNLDDLRKMAVTLDNAEKEYKLGKVGEWASKANNLVTESYQNVDVRAKIAAFRSLVDLEVDPDIAARRVAEGFQNFRRIGRTYDLMSKTPVVGPPFAKFAGDLQRILRSSVKNPLNLAAILIAYSQAEKHASLWSGESPDDRDLRVGGRRSAKIPLPDFMGGSIPLEWKIGNKTINLARFVFPAYSYFDETDYFGAFQRLLPVNVGFRDTPEGKRFDYNKFLSADMLWQPWVNIGFDRDFSGLPIQDPSITYYKPESKLSDAHKQEHIIRFLLRSYIPGYGGMLDDVATVTDDFTDFSGKLTDKYGREKSAAMVIGKYVTGINIQDFSDKRYREIAENTILKEARIISQCVSDLKSLKKRKDGLDKDNPISDKDYKEQVAVVTLRLNDATVKAKEKMLKAIKRVPKDKIMQLLKDNEINNRFKVLKELGLVNESAEGEEEPMTIGDEEGVGLGEEEPVVIPD